MACCNHVEKMAALEDLKNSALSFGFDMAWITELINKYGDDVLNLVLEGVRTGLTKEFIIEVLGKFGPIVLELLVNLVNNWKLVQGVAPVEQLNFDSQFFQVLVEKYLPMLFEKYGEQLVAAIVEFLLNVMRK